MSYGAEICFKQLAAADVFSFFQKLKAECTAKFEAIAEKEFLYLPSTTSQYKGIDDYNLQLINRNWMRNSIFSFRYFYLPELQLLGMFSIPDAVQFLFDAVIYFQNSTDQDYDFNSWKGIDDFEIIASKWQMVSEEVVFKHYVETRDSHEDRDSFDYEYYRKTFAYEEIWSLIDKFLYNEELVVYTSLYGGYEIHEMQTFCNLCQQKFNDWRAKLQREKAEK